MNLKAIHGHGACFGNSLDNFLQLSIQQAQILGLLSRTPSTARNAIEDSEQSFLQLVITIFEHSLLPAFWPLYSMSCSLLVSGVIADPGMMKDQHNNELSRSAIAIYSTSVHVPDSPAD